MKRILYTLCLLPLIAGCSATRYSTLTVASTKNFETKEININKLERSKNVTGSSWALRIIGIPFGSPTIEKAVEDTLENGNGDLLVDGAVYTKWWGFPALIGATGWYVKGDVVKTSANTKVDTIPTFENTPIENIKLSNPQTNSFETTQGEI